MDRKLVYTLLFLLFPPFLFSQDAIEELKFKNKLSNWAIEELVERQHHEYRYRIKERNQKWIILGVGIITTFTPLMGTIIQAMTGNGTCSCPVEGSVSANITW